MSVLGALFAHQGGWDEVLLILMPVALFAALLWLANRRANTALGQADPGPADAPPSMPSTTTGPVEGPPPGPDEDAATNP